MEKVRKALSDYIDSVDRKPFVPGEFDCALFAADVAQIKCGIDIAATHRGKYRTIEEGFSILQDQGFESHIAVCDSYFKRVHPSSCEDGDIVAVGDVESALEFSLGFVFGSRCYILTTNGIGTVPRRFAKIAWSVR